MLVIFLHIRWTTHLAENNLVKNGYLAVDLFFVLSGFVIAANYSRRISSLADAGRFFIVRFFRLYPLHLTILLAFVAIECAKLAANVSFGVAVGEQTPFTKHNSLPALFANLLLVQGLNLFDWPTWNFPSWSISCEMAAYAVFVFPFLWRAIDSRLYVALAMLGSVAIYFGLALSFGTLDVTTNWGILRCVAGFFIGTWLYSVSTKRLVREPLYEVIVVLALLLVMGFFTGLWVVFSVPLIALLIFFLRTDDGPIARLLLSRPLQFLGKISYSIYMVHQLIIVVLMIVLKRISAAPLLLNADGQTIVDLNPWIGDVLALIVIGATVAASTITFKFVEEPGRLFGKRLVTAGRVTSKIA